MEQWRTGGFFAARFGNGTQARPEEDSGGGFSLACALPVRCFNCPAFVGRKFPGTVLRGGGRFVRKEISRNENVACWRSSSRSQ